MKKVIERINSSIVKEQLRQHGKPSSSSMDKDTPKKEKKWPFSQKLSGSAKDVQLQAGAEEEVEGMRVDFIWFFSLSLLQAPCWLLRLTGLHLFGLIALSLHPHPPSPAPLLAVVSFMWIFYHCWYLELLFPCEYIAIWNVSVFHMFLWQTSENLKIWATIITG